MLQTRWYTVLLFFRNNYTEQEENQIGQITYSRIVCKYYGVWKRRLNFLQLARLEKKARLPHNAANDKSSWSELGLSSPFPLCQPK